MDSGSEVFCTEEPHLAVSGADIVYTDVWASMGQEAEVGKRHRIFVSYQVNSQLLSLAKEDAILMHPLPAHRGQEVTDDILDSPASVVFDQAENRLHLTKALLLEMLGGLEIPLASYR
jgi:ornithine carbamoyltransferase